MEKPLVSIVIPFFNPDEYFSKLLKSLEAQTYKNIEIILVNDGSNEECKKIADFFVKKNKNTILINQENSGVAKARQIGIDNTKGDFIIHADADDLLPNHAIEKLVLKQLETGSDIVIGSYLIRNKKKDTLILPPKDTRYQSIIEQLLSGQIHGSLCNKLIRKELYKDVKFESNINYMEDLLILAKIIHNQKCKIASTNEVVYIYRQHINSTTAKLSLNSVLSAKKVNLILIDLYKNKAPNSIINKLEKKSRASLLLQSARNNIRIFEKKDNELLSYKEIGREKRFCLWLIKLNLIWVIRIYYFSRSIIKY